MALPTVTGFLDEVNGIVVPFDVGTWETYDSWAETPAWTTPADPLIWIADFIDLETVQDFTLNIDTVANGSVSYDIITSDTGAFTGEETVTNIQPGDEGIPAFRGRFVIVIVNVSVTTGINTLNSVGITTSDRTVDIKLNAVNTSTLPGTVSSRELVLPRTPSKVVHMQITPEQVTEFNIDVYVTNRPTSTQLVPRIVSRTMPVTIALQGRDGVDRDGVCDVLLSVLPEQFMLGPNLKTR